MTDDGDGRELLDGLEDAERRLEAIAEIAPSPELRRRLEDADADWPPSRRSHPVRWMRKARPRWIWQRRRAP
jgi:hypothetical protein